MQSTHNGYYQGSSPCILIIFFLISLSILNMFLFKLYKVYKKIKNKLKEAINYSLFIYIHISQKLQYGGLLSSRNLIIMLFLYFNSIPFFLLLV